MSNSNNNNKTFVQNADFDNAEVTPTKRGTHTHTKSKCVLDFIYSNKIFIYFKLQMCHINILLFIWEKHNAPIGVHKYSENSNSSYAPNEQSVTIIKKYIFRMDKTLLAYFSGVYD